METQDQKALCQKNALHFKCDTNAAPPVVPSVELEEHLSTMAVHISSNAWPKGQNGKRMRRKASRPFLHGVEIRTLTSPHLLSGETGLFAIRPFLQFDIVGEYVGKVTERGGGEYSTYLESHTILGGLGLDAQNFGNEARTINHYRDIAEQPNVVMKICYVESLPRVMIVCRRDIAAEEEFLLSYGDEYVGAFLSGPKPVVPPAVAVSWNELAGADCD